MFEAIAKTFRGERPLVITYWVWGILLGAGLTTFGFLLPWLYAPLIFDVPRIDKVAYYGYITLYGAFVVFFAGAVWRSSENYNGSKVWAILARVVVVSTVGRFVMLLLGAPQTSASLET